jgi:hypothetical protein
MMPKYGAKDVSPLLKNYGFNFNMNIYRKNTKAPHMSFRKNTKATQMSSRKNAKAPHMSSRKNVLWTFYPGSILLMIKTFYPVSI